MLQDSGIPRGNVFVQTKLWRSFVGTDKKSGRQLLGPPPAGTNKEIHAVQRLKLDVQFVHARLILNVARVLYYRGML